MRSSYFLLAAAAATVLFGAGYTSGPFFTGGDAEASGGYIGKPSPTTYDASSKAKSGGRSVPKAENITLSSGNTIVFRAVVTPLSVAAAQQQLLDLNKSLGSGKPIYLVLDTPGGDISAGSLFIDTAKSLGRPVHTISLFAASMGFGIVQRLDKRYITPSGTLMAHRARVEGVSGQIPGEFLTAVGVIYRAVTKMEMQNAARLGISFQDYTALVKDEYWVTGEDAVAENAADAIANIKCDDSLSGTNKKYYDTMFGSAEVTFSNCPAISSPLAIKFANPNVDKKEAARYMSDYNLLRKALIGIR